MGECGCLIKFAGHKTLEGHYANVILIAVRSKCHQSRTASIYRTRPKNKIRNLQKWLNSLQSIGTPPDINVDSNLNNFKPVQVEEKRQVMIWHFSLAPYECFCEYSPIIRLPSVGMHRSFLLQVFPLLGGGSLFYWCVSLYAECMYWCLKCIYGQQSLVDLRYMPATGAWNCTVQRAPIVVTH